MAPQVPAIPERAEAGAGAVPRSEQYGHQESEEEKHG
jgi:hypothetical protein